jgi:hypothetical protein
MDGIKKCHYSPWFAREKFHTYWISVGQFPFYSSFLLLMRNLAYFSLIDFLFHELGVMKHWGGGGRGRDEWIFPMDLKKKGNWKESGFSSLPLSMGDQSGCVSWRNDWMGGREEGRGLVCANRSRPRIEWMNGLYGLMGSEGKKKRLLWAKKAARFFPKVVCVWLLVIVTIYSCEHWSIIS